MLKDKNTGETWEGVIGNLPLNDSYKLVDSYYLKDMYTICSNCGHIIRNVYVIENTKGQTFDVGSECVERFQGLNPSDILEAKRQLSVIRRFVRWAGKNCKTHIYNKYGSHWFYDREVDKWDSDFAFSCGGNFYNEKKLGQYLPEDVKTIYDMEE